MVIINAYLGAGSGSAVPVGKCQLDILWVPNDSQNLNNATVTITGTATYTAHTDASGYASVLVDAGTYTVNVTPASGSYKVTAVSNVVAESGTVKPVAVFGQGPRRVTFRSGTGTISSASWSVKKGSTVVASGSGWTESKTADLLDDTYTFSVTAFGITATQNFTSSATNSVIDVANCFCKVTISGASALTITSTFKGTSVGTGRTQYCVRGTTALAYTGTVSQKIDNQVIATVSNTTFTPNAASVTVTLTVTGKPILITATKTINIPLKANYKVLAIGGGGGGGYQTVMGGSSGVVSIKTLNIASGNYTATIGNGGAVNANGGATSLGTLISAAGGSKNSDYNSGNDHSTGGFYDYDQFLKVDNTSGGRGYGGHFGAGLRGYSTAQAGTALSNSDGFYTQTGSGYTAGTGDCGGGGGEGAKGGNAGSVTGSWGNRIKSSGGGGGGGIAGGDGGNGSNITPSSYQTIAQAGKGYGAGGGGKGGILSEYDSDEDQDYNMYVGGGGGGGGLYNVNNGSVQTGKSGAIQIMWVS